MLDISLLLVFQCTESQLRKAFEAFGEVIEVTVPQRPGLCAGQRFVIFISVVVMFGCRLFVSQCS